MTQSLDVCQLAHLETYDPLLSLRTWHGAGGRRAWDLRSWGNLVRCDLRWLVDGHWEGISKTSASIEEAVYVAIDSFNNPARTGAPS